MLLKLQPGLFALRPAFYGSCSLLLTAILVMTISGTGADLLSKDQTNPEKRPQFSFLEQVRQLHSRDPGAVERSFVLNMEKSYSQAAQRNQIYVTSVSYADYKDYTLVGGSFFGQLNMNSNGKVSKVTGEIRRYIHIEGMEQLEFVCLLDIEACPPVENIASEFIFHMFARRDADTARALKGSEKCSGPSSTTAAGMNARTLRICLFGKSLLVSVSGFAPGRVWELFHTDITQSYRKMTGG